MNPKKQLFNNPNLMNLHSELKQSYRQIYESNQLQLFNTNDQNDKKFHLGPKKHFKYSGSIRQLNEAEYAKLNNLNRENDKEKSDKQPEEKDQSDSATDSLSLIQENEKTSIKLTDSMLWHELLKKQQNIFLPLDYEDFIITSFNGNYQFFENMDVLIDEGYYSKIFYGYCFQKRESIAVKIQNYNPQELVENQFQYSLHHQIYSLYPNQFLRIDYPIYVNQDTVDSIKIVSKYELGQNNLHRYCLKKKLDDNEINLIYKQVLQQILLMHQHNIAHRDIKPQNIIFVKNKGWLLCDFEFSMKYTTQISVCSIKGTRSFLPPYLYRQSNIQGVMAKQDLFFNDQYALGVTLIVIKYQIQNSNDLQKLIINETNPNIVFLLNQSQKEQLYSQNANYEIHFIQPRIDCTIIQESSTQLKTDQIISLIKSLQKFGQEDNELRDQLIKIIDQNLIDDREDYFYINFAIYENITIYLSRFKNMVDLKLLRSSKFWRRFQDCNSVRSQLFILKFLQTLGLQEIVIKLGKHYLNQHYNLAIHVLIARMLYFLKEDDLVYQEYRQMIKIKEFQYLTSVEQSEFIDFTFDLFHWNLIDEMDMKYIQQFYFNPNFKVDYQIYDLYENEKDNKESFLSYIFNNYKTKNTYEGLYQHLQDFIMRVGSNKLSMSSNHCLKLYELSFKYLFIEDTVKLDQLMVQQVKFFTFSVQFQQLLKQSVFLRFLYTHPKNRKESHIKKIKLFKSMNFTLLFFSESQQQQLILNLIKQSAIFIYQIRNQRKLTQIINRISNLCQQFSLLTYNYYKIVFLVQLSQILFDARLHTQESLKWNKIAVWQTKNINVYSNLLDEANFGFHYDNMINYWNRIKNQRRHDQLVSQLLSQPSQMWFKQCYEYKFAQINDSIPILLKLSQDQRLTSYFLYQQNLYR